MIVLDTHTWVWWVMDVPRLAPAHRRVIEANEAAGPGVSVVSCWEVAMLAARNRLALPLPVEAWLDIALTYPGVRLLDLTLRIAVESARLPGNFHRDPADQIIVATARVLGCALVTVDPRVLDYPHVQTIAPGR